MAGKLLEDVASPNHANPTLGEAVQEAALLALGTPCIFDAVREAVIVDERG